MNRLESQQNHYHYHHHPHQTLGNSTEQLVSPQHQHTNYQQMHQSHQMHQHQQSPQQLNGSRVSEEAPREILSVSGKKKCSYCSEELGKLVCFFLDSRLLQCINYISLNCTGLN